MPVEIGWILVGPMDPIDLEATTRAREIILEELQRLFPQFYWRLPRILLHQQTVGLREEPVRLFDFGTTERNIRHLDLGIVLTSADLVGHNKPFTLAVFSTSLGLIAVSTSRLDPKTEERRVSREERVAILAHRIQACVLHSLGHLMGLRHDEEATNWMYDFQTVEELDAAREFNESQCEQMAESLREIADLRLEEEPRLARSAIARFYALSIWRNRREIMQAVLRAEPWYFPVRLTRLATAALSALVVLMMTAESWELGMSLSPTMAACISMICLLGTSLFVVRRQRLLMRREQRGAEERKVVANVSGLLIVAIGMLTTYVGLFVMALFTSHILFSRSVVESWAESVETIGRVQYFCLAAYLASVGIVIGALGASFEEHNLFRHVISVDEEM